MPISHVSLPTTPAHFALMRSFYLAALAPLGYVTYYDRANSMLGLMTEGKVPDFWLHAGDAADVVDLAKRPHTRTHVAFEAESREVVDRWYEASIKAGWTSNGAPGLRAAYSPTLYAAFVLDPLGNNIEACHCGSGSDHKK